MTSMVSDVVNPRTAAPDSVAGQLIGQVRRDGLSLVKPGSPVQIEVPRDRDGSFCPIMVRERQCRLGGVDEIILFLSAKGLAIGETAKVASYFVLMRHGRPLPSYVAAWTHITRMRRGTLLARVAKRIRKSIIGLVITTARYLDD